MVHEHREKNDDGEWNPDKPQKSAFSQAHCMSLTVLQRWNGRLEDWFHVRARLSDLQEIFSAMIEVRALVASEQLDDAFPKPVGSI
jgi:hypothetical protein